MTARVVLSVLFATAVATSSVRAQAPAEAPLAARYLDAANGLSLEQAITRALDQEPSLRAARTGIDAAQGMRQQASLRPNPSLSFERREEPGGMDSQTMVAMEWPLDLFRRSPRVAVAAREVDVTERQVADRERLLASEVRARYGAVVAALRDLTTLDDLVAAARRQHDVLRARVDEGTTPPIDRDVFDVELRRLDSLRLLQAGRAEAALFDLKRILGMRAEADLTVRDGLESLVRDEAPPAASPPAAPDAVEQRADVREAAARVAVADARIARARAEGRFDVSLFANYSRMNTGFAQRGFAPDGDLDRVGGVFHYVGAGATVTVPLLNRNQGEVAAATAERAGTEAAYAAVRLDADAEIAAARAREARARQAARVGAGARTLARQNMTVIQESYQLGRVTIFDVLEEQRRVLDVERAYTEALGAAWEARTALTRALGGVR